ncbi:hypothetical protein GCM10009541_28130 [Micromonospora gifhornensis]|uniref:Lipoprotein n=1 Tax=Micromonospora gifhornensis TaxID=84594 RepID=A0ABQ4I821_9ACTN|nr:MULTISPECIES: hypothetical protein [Micromonospora]PMR62229.1 hypothetical protein C1A38_04365 [Verrucosispora sp. ts21]GIJ14045.1 hypothetical protein Vgi01_07290 [Micromonospora gifhornensis]
MPAPSATLRALAASVVVLLSVTGCQALDDAGRAMGRTDIVNDLAARMNRALELTYSAEYQLGGGRTALIAQDPDRSAYEWPGGKLTATAEATARCDTEGKRTVCTLHAPPAADSNPSTVVYAAAEREGLVTPPMVMGLLTAAGLDPGAVITQSGTTVAGLLATCVEVQQAVENFSACVTGEGALGSFTGRVDGEPVELALSRFQEQVDGATFELPQGAGIVDRRRAGS